MGKLNLFWKEKVIIYFPEQNEEIVIENGWITRIDQENMEITICGDEITIQESSLAKECEKEL